jgi:hypothetical protein
LRQDAAQPGDQPAQSSVVGYLTSQLDKAKTMAYNMGGQSPILLQGVCNGPTR